FEVNVFGLLKASKAVFSLLRALEGTVVNQSPVAGYYRMRQPFLKSCSASQISVMAINNTLQVELAPFDVKVVTLSTGNVDT
ncbi:hypothetical protein DOTSEDRAFT_108081, partial [Dothistroma septosporum NZE10]